MMILSIEKEKLLQYIVNQINVLFKDEIEIDKKEFSNYLDIALNRFNYCAKYIKQKNFQQNGEVFFNHLNSDQYAMLLYLISNTVFQHNGNLNLATKLFLLNKTLHSLDIFYEVMLPDIFLFIHPVGTVVGRAKFDDYLILYQGCTIGGSFDKSNILQYPNFEGKNILYAHSSVLGNSNIKKNTLISAHSVIINKKIDDNKIIFGITPNLVIRENTTKHIDYFFDIQ